MDQSEWSLAELDALVGKTLEIEDHPADYRHRLRHHVMATLFLEPSTRTQLSFQTAMLRLGGQYISVNDPQTSSLAKGESLMDTVRVVGGYADTLVLRHPCEGAARVASCYVPPGCAVINAGDGGHLHPTQTLTDLATLMRVKGRLSGLTIGLCGDLKYGRTVHSLIKTLARYPNNRFVLIAPVGLGLPANLIGALNAQNVLITETTSLSEVIGELDVLYMTRLQVERFESTAAVADALPNDWFLTTETLGRGRADLCVMHPLPRVDEIDPAVDADPRATYFQQASMGVYARMALLLRLLEGERAMPVALPPASGNEAPCPNPRCITHQQPALPHTYRPNTESGDSHVCFFCDQQQLSD